MKGDAFGKASSAFLREVQVEVEPGCEDPADGDLCAGSARKHEVDVLTEAVGVGVNDACTHEGERNEVPNRILAHHEAASEVELGASVLIRQRVAFHAAPTMRAIELETQMQTELGGPRS